MSLTLELVTPERLLYSGSVSSVVIPAAKGEMEVLPGHLPLVSTVASGPLVAKGADGEGSVMFAVSEGFVEVLPDKVTVLAETAEGEHEIDIEEARKVASQMEDKLAKLGHEEADEAFVFRTALERAQSRIAVYERRDK